MPIYQCCAFDRNGKVISADVLGDGDVNARIEALRHMIEDGLCARYEVWTEGRIIDCQTGTDTESRDTLR
jgi:hypothetical protein